MTSVNGKKKGHPVLFIFMIGLIIAAFLSFTYYKNSLDPVSKTAEESIALEIPSGSSTQDIGEILERNNLIKNKWVFLFKVKTLDTKRSLKAGTYNLSQSMNLETIIESLVKGGKSGNTVRFTIPEGYELKDTARKLSEEKIVDYDRFIKLTEDKANFEEEFEFLKDLDEGKTLEGFLFPSTYEIYEKHSEEDIVRRMLEGFEKIYEKEIKRALITSNFDLNDLVTLASIIEREAKVDSERATMSGVFHNRLDVDMTLGSCATVQYILGERRTVLTNAETRIESPFNTYINKGLPPAPIASPGEKSIMAAINPEEVDYLYFTLTGADGSHTFTKTYEEHLNAAPKK
nr:endolytic transglycosylase MltG [Tissierella sp.]